MRIVCWNIERGYHPDAIARQLRELNADIYLLYELDRGVKRTHKVDMFARIGDALKMEGRYVREFEEIETVWRRIIPWGGPGGGEIGNAVFCRYPAVDYRTIDLPLKPPLTYQRTTLFPELFQPRKGCRKAQVLRIEIDGKPLAIVSVHLEIMRSDWEHRRAQLEAALEGIQNKDMIVAGDFNSIGGALRATLLNKPGFGEVSKIRKWLAERGLHDPFKDSDTTCGRLGIRAKLDWLAATKHIKIEAARIIRTASSDHACLVVDYDISSMGA